MKSIYKNITLIVLVCTALIGCSRSEFLDLDPKGITIPETVSDFRLLLDNSNLFTQKHTNTPYSSDRLLVIPELNSFIGYGRVELNLHLFKDIIFGASENDLDWDTYYEQIFNINLILDGLAEVSTGTPEEIALLVAEAKLQRAYAYFNLVNIYSLHYNVSTASTDLGVPIRKGVDVTNVDLTRASVQQVYDLVITDIESSIQHLDDTQPLSLSFRPSKTAAYALLAKVYLYQGKYDKALENIEEALTLYDVLRDINEEDVVDPSQTPNSPVPNAAPERFWPNVNQDPQVVWHKSVILDLVLNKEYGDLFEVNDLRKQWLSYFPTNFEDDGDLKAVEGYYLVANQKFDSGTEGIYTPDMYLIRAECNARLGNIQASNDDLNTLREKRFETGSFVAISITDKEELLSFVKEERKREFPSSTEGSFDIKRYNALDNDNITINHSYEDESVSVAPNSDKWAQPIGTLYTNFNPEIEQNPRN